VEKIVKHDSWPIQPDILSRPLLRLTSRKPLWLDLQPVDIKSRWRHNWKSTHVVNSHLVCDPATGFRPPSATVVSAEPFSHGTGTLRCLQKEMATCVLVVRPRRCPAPDWKRPPGRPRKTSIRQVEEDHGCTIDSLWSSVQDLSLWRSLRPSLVKRSSE